MPEALRAYCSIAFILACLVILFVGPAVSGSIQSARHQLQTVVSTLAPGPSQR